MRASRFTDTPSRGLARSVGGGRLVHRRRQLPGYLRRRVMWAVCGCALVATACTIPRWPVEGRLVSPYGLRWSGVSPDFHPGVDISVPLGSAVRAMAPGRVRFAGVMRGYGNVVWVDHAPSLMTVYAHLSRIDVDPGQAVEHRQTLGLSGQSGNATAPHLHFEVWRWGRERDPVPLLGGPP